MDFRLSAVSPKWVNLDASYLICYRHASINEVMSRVNNMTDADYPKKLERQTEMRFLRGHFYFMLKILFKYVPYIDETVPKDSYITVSNKAMSNEELWDKIADEFRFAITNLPETQAEIARPLKSTARAYWLKRFCINLISKMNNMK